IEPRDEAHAREPELVAPSPQLLGFDLDLAPARPEHEDHAGGAVETVATVVDEGRIAGRVDDVEVRLPPGAVVEAGRDGAPAPLLLRLDVEGRRAVLGAPDPRGGVAREEHRVGDERLAHPALPHDGDVADLRRVVSWHPGLRCGCR